MVTHHTWNLMVKLPLGSSSPELVFWIMDRYERVAAAMAPGAMAVVMIWSSRLSRAASSLAAWRECKQGDVW